MAAYDDLNIKRIFVVGIASVVVTAVTALAVQVLYYNMAQSTENETLAASSYTRQNQILAQQRDELQQYGVNETTGNVVVPVAKVMEQMAADGSDEIESDASASESNKEASDET